MEDFKTPDLGHIKRMFAYFAKEKVSVFFFFKKIGRDKILFCILSRIIIYLALYIYYPSLSVFIYYYLLSFLLCKNKFLSCNYLITHGQLARIKEGIIGITKEIYLRR